MIKHNQDGAVSGLLISFILTVLLLLATIGFAAWAYTGRQDYKNNVDSKISAAVEESNRKLSVAKDAEFAEKVKIPYDRYNGPAAYGSLIVDYPKTWSAYVDESGRGAGGALLDGYFAPGTVPSTEAKESVFALKVQVVNKGYAESLKNLTSRQRDGSFTVAAYALPKLPDVVGVRISGQITEGRTTTMVVLPLRSYTLQISTDGTQFLSDFNNHILPNFTFSP